MRMTSAPPIINHQTPAGYLAEVVTTLEMAARPADVAPPAERDGLSLRRLIKPTPTQYLALFRLVGEDWLWDSRLRLSESELVGVIHDERVETYALMRGDVESGMLELDFREPGVCELTYFGVASSAIGTGAGGWMMRHVIHRAWSQPISRLWVHTCSLDHPRALGFYQRAGFVAISREVNFFPDPRLLGRYPRSMAPQIPLIEA